MEVGYFSFIFLFFDLHYIFVDVYSDGRLIVVVTKLDRLEPSTHPFDEPMIAVIINDVRESIHKATGSTICPEDVIFASSQYFQIGNSIRASCEDGGSKEQESRKNAIHLLTTCPDFYLDGGQGRSVGERLDDLSTFELGNSLRMCSNVPKFMR